MSALYNDYNSYLRARFGCRVYRIALDAGFTCPNRDGTKGRGGCHFCNEDGSRSLYTDPGKKIKEQIASRIDFLTKRSADARFIAYFQAFSNTYASVERLKEVYDPIKAFDRIVGITIGTRPDTVDEKKIQLISSYSDRYDVWIEFGLQSANNSTLKSLNRAHTYEDFADAVKMAKDHGIRVSAHVIIGLPDESEKDCLKTAECLNSLSIDGVKIHAFHILKGSLFEGIYRKGKLRLMEEDEYINSVCSFLEHLDRRIIIQRLTAQGHKDKHIAPQWALDKLDIIRKVGEELKRRAGAQGCRSKSR